MKIIKSTAANWKNGDQGAATTLVAAFDPKLNGMSFLDWIGAVEF